MKRILCLTALMMALGVLLPTTASAQSCTFCVECGDDVIALCALSDSDLAALQRVLVDG